MVCDPYWKESFDAGKIIEEVSFKEYRAVLASNSSSIGNFYYPYRMFVFHQKSSVPCFILNLEIGLRFDTCVLGAHTHTEHVNYGPGDPNMTFDDFKSWAMSTAKQMGLQEATDGEGER